MHVCNLSVELAQIVPDIVETTIELALYQTDFQICAMGQWSMMKYSGKDSELCSSIPLSYGLYSSFFL